MKHLIIPAPVSRIECRQYANRRVRPAMGPDTIVVAVAANDIVKTQFAYSHLSTAYKKNPLLWNRICVVLETVFSQIRNRYLVSDYILDWHIQDTPAKFLFQIIPRSNKAVVTFPKGECIAAHEPR